MVYDMGHLFFFFPSTSRILSSPSIILLLVMLVPSRVFLISFIALLIIYQLYFISSWSLLNLSCIFSILVSRLFICNSTLLSRFWIMFNIIKVFLDGLDGKVSVHNVGDLGSIPGLGRSPGEGNDNPLQHYCLENPMDRGAW